MTLTETEQNLHGRLVLLNKAIHSLAEAVDGLQQQITLQDKRIAELERASAHR